MARSSMSPDPFGLHMSRMSSWPQARLTPAARSLLIGGTGKSKAAAVVRVIPAAASPARSPTMLEASRGDGASVRRSRNAIADSLLDALRRGADDLGQPTGPVGH